MAGPRCGVWGLQWDGTRSWTGRCGKAETARLEWVRRFLKVFGTEQGKNESLAEAMARTMQISCLELKARFQAAAAGGS